MPNNYTKVMLIPKIKKIGTLKISLMFDAYRY